MTIHLTRRPAFSFSWYWSIWLVWPCPACMALFAVLRMCATKCFFFSGQFIVFKNAFQNSSNKDLWSVTGKSVEHNDWLQQWRTHEHFLFHIMHGLDIGVEAIQFTCIAWTSQGAVKHNHSVQRWSSLHLDCEVLPVSAGECKWSLVDGGTGTELVQAVQAELNGPLASVSKNSYSAVSVPVNITAPGFS